MPNFYEQMFWGAILHFLYFQKGTHWATIWFEKHRKRSTPDGPGCPSSDPAFHETIVHTVMFGPSGFEKVMSSMEIAHFLFLPAFLCAIFYITCL